MIICNLRMQYHLLVVLVLNCTFQYNEDGAMDRTLSFVNGKKLRYGLNLLCTGDISSTYHFAPMKVLISNSTFLGNKGGGFYSESFGGVHSLEILNSRFIDNTVKGVSIFLCTLNHGRVNVAIAIRNSTFINNRGSLADGGALHIYLLSGDFDRIVLDVKHCHFEYNSAAYPFTGYHKAGGLMLAVNTECTLRSMSVSMYDTHFAGNDRGHVALELLKGSEVHINSCTFRQGHGGQGSYGGAINIIIVIPSKDSPFRSSGKKILVIIMRTIFLNNSAWNGGAISMKLQNKVTTSTYMINCVFTTNHAESYGGAILLRLSMRHPTILFERYQNVIIENTTLSDNSAMRGAGVHIDCETVGTVTVLQYITVVVHSSIFIRNIGAPIDVDIVGTALGLRIYINVTLSQFHNNVAVNPLADIYVNNLYVTSIINVKEEKEDRFTQLTIGNTEFVGNRGSCIVVRGSPQLTLVGKVTFTGNTAFAGAAILLDCLNVHLPSVLNLQSNTTVLITNNTAWHFGAVQLLCHIFER